jgi:predicted nucleic acid-binding protein
MKILIDTNILLYALDNQSKFYKKSRDILENKNYRLYISTKNIAEVFAVSSKLGIDKSYILSYLTEDILPVSTLIYPNRNSFQIFLKIISDHDVKGNKVFDMEIASIMLANKIFTIASFNYKDFENIPEITILKECF